MALELVSRSFGFRTREIWFSEVPFDVRHCSEVSFRECKKEIDIGGFTCSKFTTLVIDMESDLDVIWSGIKANYRNEISRARREGITVALNEGYDQFNLLNKDFREKKGLGNSPLDREAIEKHGTLFLAKYNGEAVVGQVYLRDEGNMRWVIGASKRLNSDKNLSKVIGFGNRLLVWEAIRFAKEKGVREFDMGGYYTGNDESDERHKINAFKKGFGGRIVTHYNYQKCYSDLYRALRGLKRRFETLAGSLRIGRRSPLRRGALQ